MSRREIGLAWKSLGGVSLFGLSLACAACSDPADLSRHSGSTLARDRPEFGAQEKRVAEALSLGNERVTLPASDPYRQALLCSAAFTALRSRLASMGGGDPTIGPAVERAQAHFDSRLQRFAETEKKSAADIATDRSAQDAQLPDEATKIRVAIGCIRGLR